MNQGGPGAAGATGLAASLRQLVASLLELAQVRLELLGTELEQQKLRVASGLVWAAIAVVLFALALVLLAGCVLLLFGEAYRLQAAATLMVVFVGCGALAWRHALARLKTPPGAFALSAAELGRDRSGLAAGADAPTRQP
ncbi:MAG: phage holin family protein [Ideonella sp.]|nr:phage holin family protein [Ideonella sp.]